jgi:hypothetical protein
MLGENRRETEDGRRKVSFASLVVEKLAFTEREMTVVYLFS